LSPGCTSAPSVTPGVSASLQKEGYLTTKQAKGLNATFALEVGKKNKKNKRKPK
jgi:hypothetical protein